MGQFQDQFEQGLDQLPHAALRALVRDKLAPQGVEDVELADRVVVAIMARDDDSDEIDIDLPCKLGFTAADTARIV